MDLFDVGCFIGFNIFLFYTVLLAMTILLTTYWLGQVHTQSSKHEYVVRTAMKTFYSL